MRYCRFHCRRCDSHFTSLRGFDAHLKRHKFVNARGVADYTLTHLDPATITTGRNALVEVVGTCRISDGRDHPRYPVSIWASPGPPEPPHRARARHAGGGVRV